MKLKDKKFKTIVDVLDKDCFDRRCYRPRQDPGIFTQGVGYRYRSDDWLCGYREIHGCPELKDR